MTIKMVMPREFGFLFHLSADNTNFRGYTIVPFLNHLYNKLHGRINLVWDSIKIHTAEPISVFLALHPTIKEFFFPPYAPELNPVDNIWGYIKYKRLANFCPHNLVELRRHVRAELFRIQKRQDLLESLFHHTGLDLE
jgi:transposase